MPMIKNENGNPRNLVEARAERKCPVTGREEELLVSFREFPAPGDKVVAFVYSVPSKEERAIGEVSHKMYLTLDEIREIIYLLKDLYK